MSWMDVYGAMVLGVPGGGGAGVYAGAAGVVSGGEVVMMTTGPTKKRTGMLNTYRVRCNIVVWWGDGDLVREHIYPVDRIVKALDERYAGAALNDEYGQRFRKKHGYREAYLRVFCRDFSAEVVQPRKAEEAANEVAATMLPGM